MTTTQPPQLLEDCTNDNTPVFTFANQIKQAKIIDVYDGDTCKACFAFEGKYQKFSLRMYGYNCAEMKPAKTDPDRDAIKEKAIKARDFLRTQVLGKIVFLQCLEWDKYGRILARIYLDSSLADSVCINTQMINLGYGKPYFGSGDKEF